MPTTPPAVSTSPTVPDPSDRATFNARSYPWTIWMRDVSTELNAVGVNTYNNAVEASNNSADSLIFRNSAETNANTAAMFSGAVLWVSGTTYTIGSIQYDPSNMLPYRRKVTGSGTLNPSSDATNYALLTTNQSLPVQDVSGTIFVQGGVHYRVTGSYSIVLMAFPSVGTYLEITNNSGQITSGVTNNGKKIMGLDEGMFIDQLNIKIGLYFTGDTYGWLVK